VAGEAVETEVRNVPGFRNTDFFCRTNGKVFEVSEAYAGGGFWAETSGLCPVSTCRNRAKFPLEKEGERERE
jgi:hypothetical protein